MHIELWLLWPYICVLYLTRSVRQNALTGGHLPHIREGPKLRRAHMKLRRKLDAQLAIGGLVAG